MHLRVRASIGGILAGLAPLFVASPAACQGEEIAPLSVRSVNESHVL
jgi:hypothetical protein